MQITLVRNLMEQYGIKLLDQRLADQDIDVLLNSTTFAPSSEDVDPELPLSDENYSTADAMRLFILAIAPQMSIEESIAFTERLINQTSSLVSIGAFLQTASLAKFFLAYLNAKEVDQNEISRLLKLLVSKINPTSVEAENVSLISRLMQSVSTQSQFFIKALPERFEVALFEEPEQENINLTHETDTLTAVLTLTDQQQADITTLKSFVSSYQMGAVLEGIRRAEKVNGEQRSTLKARVGKDLITAIKTNADLSNAFTASLEAHKLTAEQFFDGSTQRHLNNDALYNLLKGFVRAGTPSEHEFDLHTGDQVEIGTETFEETLTPKKTSFMSGLGKMNLFGNGANTASEGTNANFIAELTKYAKHYGNSINQLHESIWNKGKVTSKGIPSAIAKAQVANGLLIILEDNDPDQNIAERFSVLLDETGLTRTAFFDGKIKLSTELQDLLLEAATAQLDAI